MLVCHAGVTVTLNPHTGFKPVRTVGFFLHLGLPVCCHQDFLAYLVIVAKVSPLPREAKAGIVDFFLVFSACLLISLCVLAVLLPLS
jgi:hypothetical protein